MRALCNCKHAALLLAEGKVMIASAIAHLISWWCRGGRRLLQRRRGHVSWQPWRHHCPLSQELSRGMRL
jgi:hypothetical protein